MTKRSRKMVTKPELLVVKDEMLVVKAPCCNYKMCENFFRILDYDKNLLGILWNYDVKMMSKKQQLKVHFWSCILLPTIAKSILPNLCVV